MEKVKTKKIEGNHPKKEVDQEETKKRKPDAEIEITTKKQKTEKITKTKETNATDIVINSNWEKMKETILENKKRYPKKKKENEEENPTEITQTATSTATLFTNSTDNSETKYVSLDCEMVEGVSGQNLLARVVIVNSHGNCIYDKYVIPMEKVSDYRFKITGITEEHLKPGKAFPFKDVQREVADLIKSKIVIGHDLRHDFRALLLKHPFVMTRDTAKFRFLQAKKGKARALRKLAWEHLNLSIQQGVHDPCEDARATLLLYKKFKKEMEERFASHSKKKVKKGKKEESKSKET